MDDLMTRVKKLRKDKKERLYKIAEKCGISKNVFYNYSIGRTPINEQDGEIIDYYLKHKGY